MIAALDLPRLHCLPRIRDQVAVREDRAERPPGHRRGVDDHAAAVERELTDQLWSMDQPAFAERLAAIQARISGK